MHKWNYPLTVHGAYVGVASYSRLTEAMLDGFFRHYHASYPIVHEPDFRAEYSEVISKPSPTAEELLRLGSNRTLQSQESSVFCTRHSGDQVTACVSLLYNKMMRASKLAVNGEFPSLTKVLSNPAKPHERH